MQDDYERGDADYTATELIRPVRINAYLRAHRDEIVEDVSDRVWAFAGQVKHSILRRIAELDPDRYIVEERYTAVSPDGFKVSAQLDLLDKETKTLYDWKETSVWKFMLGDTREWEEQANINLLALRLNGVEVMHVKNVALLKDWKKRKARFTRQGGYPQCAIHVVDLPMWTMDQAKDFIVAKIERLKHQMDNPPVCTKEERWQMDQVYALHREGRKSAIRLYSDKDQAEGALLEAMKRKKPWEKFYLQERQAEPRRCLDFCPVSQFCDYGIEVNKKWNEKEKNEVA